MPSYDAIFLSRNNRKYLCFGLLCALIVHTASLAYMINHQHDAIIDVEAEQPSVTQVTVRFSAPSVKASPTLPTPSQSTISTTSPVSIASVPQKTEVATPKEVSPENIRPIPRMFKKPPPPKRKVIKKRTKNIRRPSQQEPHIRQHPVSRKTTKPSPRTPLKQLPSRKKPQAAPATSVARTSPASSSVSAPVIRSARIKGNRIKPSYPKRARRLHQEGTVMLNVTISTSGRISAVTLQQSSGYPLLDKEAIRAVKRRSFVPKTIDGKAVSSRVIIPIQFKLQ